MKNLSEDIELAVTNCIEILNFKVDISKIKSDNVEAVMKSKVDSFSSCKELIVSWQNSMNAPADTKLRMHIQSLVNAGENSIEVLRKALRKKIEADDVAPERHGMATKAKPLIFKAINEINAGVIELKLQLDAGKYNLATQEFKRGYPERFANQEFYPLKDYHKTWYDKDTDSIMICPLGTKGEVITIDNLNIMLPKVPANKKNILFYGYKDKSEQYWRRLPVPTGLIPENEDQYADFILKEFKRRREGVWFFNNGIPTYLTPAHYMGLQWNQMKDNGGYKEYRYAQALMYYFTQACIIDPRCLGEAFVKGRRTGFTEEIIDHFINDSTSTKNALFGMTSKTGIDGQAVFEKYSYGVQNLPFFFIPVVKGKIDDAEKMIFGKVSDNSKIAKKKKDTQTNDYLNTRVDYMNAITLAYDSKKLYRYLGDECFAKGTKILMSDYTFKNIEEIKIGDFVRVEGDKSVEVINTLNGIDDLYEIEQPYGKSYIVNSQHRLYLERGNAFRKNGIKIMRPIDYLQMSHFEKRTTVRVLSEGFDFSEKELPIDPYMFGVWLGDGNSSESKITTNPVDDPEMLEYYKQYAKENNYILSVYNKSSDKTKEIRFSNADKFFANQTTGILNRFKKALIELNVLNNKHIPEIYLKASREQRLQLLAGLIDSDGYNSGRSYEISMSRKLLVEQIYSLCKSLGLDTSEIREKNTNFNSLCYRINFQKCSEIPCKIARKKSITSDSYKSRRLKMDVKYFGVGDYFGITLDADNDDDRRLILEDYTISMNCGKRERPQNIIDHLDNVRPTMITGGRIVGKCFFGSTLNPKDKGGAEYEVLYYGSDVSKRNANGRTTTGLYSFFLPAHKNYEDFTDKYGVCHEVVKPGESFINAQGIEMTQGSLQFLNNEFAAAKLMGSKVYNNRRRLDPITIEDAFRDELSTQIFNIEKINQQLKFNRDTNVDHTLVRGNFEWKDNLRNTTVVWKPNEKGRFLISWIPPKEMQNQFAVRPNVIIGGVSKFPLNIDVGCMGVDPYDQTAVIDSKLVSTENGAEYNLGSKGAMHGLTGFNLGNIPSNYFFLEYIARPKEADMFFDDVLMACVFYGMPILVENNKKMLLKHFKVNGYRGFCLNRFDKEVNRLSPDEKELGGIPNTSADIINQHWTGIEKYIEDFIGEYEIEEGQDPIREIGLMGSMPFARTLQDWLKFKVEERTKFDASISSGLAIMGVNRHKYKYKNMTPERVTIRIKKYATSNN